VWGEFRKARLPQRNYNGMVGGRERTDCYTRRHFIW